MYIVYYWATCPTVGKYLDKVRFDTLSDARRFAKQVKGTLEKQMVM